MSDEGKFGWTGQDANTPPKTENTPEKLAKEKPVENQEEIKAEEVETTKVVNLYTQVGIKDKNDAMNGLRDKIARGRNGEPFSSTSILAINEQINISRNAQEGLTEELYTMEKEISYIRRMFRSLEPITNLSPSYSTKDEQNVLTALADYMIERAKHQLDHVYVDKTGYQVDQTNAITRFMDVEIKAESVDVALKQHGIKLNQNQDHVARVTAEFNSFQSKTNMMLSGLATKEDNNRVSMALDSYVTNVQWDNLLQKIEGLTKLEKFNKGMQENKSELDYVKKIIVPLAKTKDVTSQVEELKDFCIDRMKLFSFRKDCKNETIDVRQKFQKTSEIMDKARGQINTLVLKVKDHDQLIEGKVAKPKFDALESLMFGLPTKDEVDQQKAHIRLTLSSFQIEQNEWKVSFKEHCEIIRQYDEVISGKASRQRLYEEIKSMRESFKPTLDNLVEETEVMAKVAEQLKTDMMMLEMKTEEKVDERLAEYLRERDEMNKALDNDPNNQANERPKAILKELKTKVSKAEIDALDKKVVKKDELKVLIDQISVLQKENTHIIVLLNESLKLNMIKKETKNAKHNRAVELCSQVQTLGNWALKYQSTAPVTERVSIQTPRRIEEQIPNVQIFGPDFSCENTGSHQSPRSQYEIDSEEDNMRDPTSNLKLSMAESKGFMRGKKFDTKSCNQFYTTSRNKINPSSSRIKSPVPPVWDDKYFSQGNFSRITSPTVNNNRQQTAGPGGRRLKQQNTGLSTDRTYSQYNNAGFNPDSQGMSPLGYPSPRNGYSQVSSLQVDKPSIRATTANLQRANVRRSQNVVHGNHLQYAQQHQYAESRQEIQLPNKIHAPKKITFDQSDREKILTQFSDPQNTMGLKQKQQEANNQLTMHLVQGRDKKISLANKFVHKKADVDENGNPIKVNKTPAKRTETLKYVPDAINSIATSESVSEVGQQKVPDSPTPKSSKK